MEKPDRLIVSVDGVPVLTSQYGHPDGQYALRVEHLINPVLNTLDEEKPMSEANNTPDMNPNTMASLCGQRQWNKKSRNREQPGV